MRKLNYQEMNSQAIDKWVENGWEWGIPVTRGVCSEAARGNWEILLTPTRPVPCEWFAPFVRDGGLRGVRLLGLASGGGQQMPVLASAGADCAVLDYSDRQLESERAVAAREGYSIDIVKADMTRPLPFPDSCFDVIVHPVSNCYIEDVYGVWNECFRILRAGGLLLSGLDNGYNFLFDSRDRPLVIANKLPFNPLRNPGQMEKLRRSGDESVQFSHSFDEQIGGQLKAGFFITAAYEDYDGDPDSLADGIPSYWATRAVKSG